MKSERRFCVYFHVNSFTEEVFYVGIGTGYRPYRHSNRNSIWHRIVKKFGFKVVIMHNELTWDEAVNFEIDYISKFGRRNNNTGCLANMTDGGDGTPGCNWNNGSKRTEEQRKKISDALKGRKINPTSVRNSVIAKKIKRDERISQGIVKEKRVLSESKLLWLRTVNIGRKKSDEAKANLSEKLKGKKRTDEQRLKLSLALKGRKFSDEHRKKTSDTMKRIWAEKKAALWPE